MKKEEQEQNPQPKNNPYTGFFIGLIIVMFLNALVFPNLFERKIIDTDYGTFISMVDEGKIEKVKIEENRIYFSVSGENNKEVTYQTGTVNDPDLVDRLLKADSPNESGKIIFTKTIPRENSPILNFLLLWVIPGLIFYFFWKQISKMTLGRMGGSDNVMSFGKSGTKIYAESEIKTTFADVAGQDEAKEALSEIVDFLHNPEKYTEIGASLPKGALLVGPPGTGKTLIARGSR